MTDSSSLTTVSQPLAGPKVSRRRFISGLAAVIVTAAAGTLGVPVLDSLHVAGAAGQAEGWLTLCSLSSLAAGQPQGFPFSRRVRNTWSESRQTGVAYVVTDNGRDVQVVANICTHGGCRVMWQEEQQAFACPCHNGQFAMDGRVLAGLPSQPLEQFPARVVRGLVQIRMEI